MYKDLHLPHYSNLGASFIIKKKALIQLQRYGLRASSGGFGYLRDWMWWAGLTSSTYKSM